MRKKRASGSRLPPTICRAPASTACLPICRVLVTSPFAAGFEPERDDGSVSYATAPPAATTADHAETRDDRAVFFVKSLPAGAHVFRHRVRATHAGSFTALPAQAELMYFPEVRGNGAGESLEVSKALPAGTSSEGK